MDSLRPYGPLLAAWAAWPGLASGARAWSLEACLERWQRGRPLLPNTSIALAHDDVEDLVAAAMEAVTAARPDEVPAMQRLADAWDARAVGPADFLPSPGGVGESLQARFGLSAAVTGFLAYAGFRPALASVLAVAHTHATEGQWPLGVCPFCGAPPGFGDILEDGRRRLACHLCGGTWIFSRARCPLCGTDGPHDLARLEPEAADAAYFVAGCTRCHGYIKEVDRRQRWNARDALVEDWGSPHLDLVARAAGYWRPLPTLLEVAVPI